MITASIWIFAVGVFLFAIGVPADLSDDGGAPALGMVLMLVAATRATLGVNK